MAVEYQINPKLGFVWSRARGVLTDSDLIDHQEELADDERFSPSFNQLFEFEDVTQMKLTSGGISVLAERNPFGRGSKRAFVVSPELPATFGMMRMFQIMTDEHPDELRVQFDNLEEARRWLGVPED